MHSFLQVALDDTMELECLSGSQLEGTVTVLIGDAVHVEPLLGRADTTGHSDSDHKRVGGLETLGLERLSDVSVILRNNQHVYLCTI